MFYSYFEANNRSNNSTSKQLIAWCYIDILSFIFDRNPNLKINMAAKLQDGRHMATKYIVGH